MNRHTTEFFVHGVILSVLLAGLCAYLAWEDHKISRRAKPTPDIVPIEQLTRSGASGNLHVRITSIHFADQYYSVNRGLNQIGVMIALKDSEGRVRALLDSSNFRNDSEIAELQKQTELVGIVVNDIESLSPAEEKYLQELGIPANQLIAVPIVKDRFTYLDQTEFYVKLVGVPVFLALEHFQ